MSPLSTELRRFAKDYAARPLLNLSPDQQDAEHALARFLLFVLLPVWTATGLFDWLCHKRTDIEHTAGLREFVITETQGVTVLPAREERTSPEVEPPPSAALGH